MITFKTYDLFPGVLSCDLLSKSEEIPNVSVWAKHSLTNDELNAMNNNNDGWVDIIIDHYQLHKAIVIDALASHFNVPADTIEIIKY